MIQQVFNTMIYMLLARFILNDLPHAARLFTNPNEELDGGGIPQEIKTQVTTRAKEAGFPGHIEFRKKLLAWSPTKGKYEVPGKFDDGDPIGKMDPMVSYLRETLPKHVREAEPVVPVIYLSYEDKTEEGILAVLAHELGHWEYWEEKILGYEPKVWYPIDLVAEVEAHSRGLKWAQKWGVLPHYVYAGKVINVRLAKRGLPPVPSLEGA